MRSLLASWRLAGPLILSNLSVPLLGMVDVGVVGHLPDPAPLAAVSLGAGLLSVLYFLFGFLRMGTTALAAQAFGAGDRAEVVATLGRALAAAAVLGLALLLLGLLVLPLAERLLAPPPDALAGFRRYVAVRLLGAPAGLANFALLGWFLGLQDARRPLLLMLLTNGINALLALLLVRGLGLAAGGAAAATVLAEYAGAGTGLLVAARRAARLGGRPSRAVFAQVERWRRLLAINRDLLLRSLFLEGAFLLFTAVGARLGAVVLAANAVLMTLFTLAAYGLDGFAHATEATVGRAVGAGARAELRAAIGAGFVNAVVLACLLTGAYHLGGRWLIALLTTQPDVRAAADALLPYAVLLPVVAVWAFLLDGVFFGAARAHVLRDGMALALLLFALLLAVLVPPLRADGLWLAFLAFLAARGLILAAALGRIGPAGLAGNLSRPASPAGS